LFFFCCLCFVSGPENVREAPSVDGANDVNHFLVKDVIIELDDGKIGTGKPDQFDGKNPWFPVKIFP